MDNFCNSTFWDWNKTWNSSDPDFTPCFEQTVLLWIPCVFLWLLSIYEIYRFSVSISPKLSLSWINISKTIILSTITCLDVATVIYATSVNANQDLDLVTLYGAIIKISTLILSLILHSAQRMSGLYTSGTQFLFWFLFSIYEAITLRTIVKNSGLPDASKVLLVIAIVHSVLVFLQFFLNFWSDSSRQRVHGRHSLIEDIDGNTCPELKASFFSQLTFHWVGDILWRGYRNPIKLHDLWELDREDKAEVLISEFEKHSRRCNTTPNRTSIYGNMLRPLFHLFGMTYLWTVVLGTGSTLSAFLPPQILSWLITFIENESEEFSWKGYLYVFLLAASSLLKAILFNQQWYMRLKMSALMKSVLSCAVYRKSLKVSKAARKETSTGEIVNLMSVDVKKVMTYVLWINEAWDSPIQIGVAMYFLYEELGVSMFAGMAVMIILIPLNVFVTKKMHVYQTSQMTIKDERVNLMTEILSGIKILKLYAWETSFENEVKKTRSNEINVLKKKAIMNSVIEFVWNCTPVLVSLASFVTFVLIDEKNILDARKAFVSLALFNLLNEPATYLPFLITKGVELHVSLKRLNDFMNAAEYNPEAISHSNNEYDAVVLKNADFSWDLDKKTLKNVNLNIKEGSLVAIVGSVGSGKSSLLSALLGEMKKLNGYINLKGKIAYVAQQPWIQNQTLQENIYFGCSPEVEKYNKIIDCCALKQDLEILPGGDQTEIGEKGINLSGGQKQRIALARAAFNNADIYLLDDPLSAVDSHVGKHIFEKLLGPSGMLQNKTRILVSHGLTYLPQMDQIVVLKDGQISEYGKYQELLKNKGAFSDFLLHYINQNNAESQDILDDLEKGVDVDKLLTEKSKAMVPHSQNGTRSSAVNKIIEDENEETGTIQLSVLSAYLKSVGWHVCAATFLMFVLYQVFSVGSNIWLAKWTEDTSLNNATEDISKRNIYLSVYGTLSLSQCVMVLFIAITVNLGNLVAAKKLHNNMLSRILHAPMVFFETTPLGRIINRFSADLQTIDSELPGVLLDCLDCFFRVLSILIIISWSTPMFIIMVAVVLVLFVLLQRYYIKTARQIFRVDSVTLSPVFSHFTETLHGVSTIRAYTDEERFIVQSQIKIDNSVKTTLHMYYCRRWLSLRLEFLGSLVIFFSGFFCVFERKTISSSVVGLSVTYALQFSQKLSWFILMSALLETYFVAVERIREYSETVQEAEWINKDRRPRKEWPEKGAIHFENYASRYRDGLELVLKNVTCRIEPGEKIGIVGRTGAGKSSMTLALFRIIEGVGGNITIDGENIADLGLHDVRGRLTIIPQDPLLYSGTMRFNLDPFSNFTDTELWTALENSHLKAYVETLPEGLEYKISEGGDNLSVGQRQLICLARAILRKTSILILDEATASVDLETDDIIQETIRKEFKDCTILTIAHRLSSVMDSTRILVMNNGEIVEFDKPENLLKGDGYFYQMVTDAGILN